MPIYEYCCQRCGHQFETLVRCRSEEHPECPKCGEKEVSRNVSAATVIGGSAEKGCAPGNKRFS